jgi:hypothetical protein
VEGVASEIREVSFSGSGMLRFLSHMLIASVLAPAAGGAIYTFYEAAWHDAAIAERVFGSFVGGFVLLFFVWFWTIPFGFLTSVICFALREADVKNSSVWGGGGAACGFVVAQFFILWASLPATLLLVDGVCVGLVTGFALREVWQLRAEKATLSQTS